MTATNKPAFVYTLYIGSSPEKVWEALTTAEFTRKYWGGRSIRSEWKVGSPVQHLKDDGTADWKGEVLEVNPPKRLAYTFGAPDENAPGDSAQRVTFDIEAYGDYTRLTITHEGLEPGSRDYMMVTNGWCAILSNLKTLLETGRPLTYPWRG